LLFWVSRSFSRWLVSPSWAVRRRPRPSAIAAIALAVAATAAPAVAAAAARAAATAAIVAVATAATAVATAAIVRIAATAAAAPAVAMVVVAAVVTRRRKPLRSRLLLRSRPLSKRSNLTCSPLEANEKPLPAAPLLAPAGGVRNRERSGSFKGPIFLFARKATSKQHKRALQLAKGSRFAVVRGNCSVRCLVDRIRAPGAWMPDPRSRLLWHPRNPLHPPPGKSLSSAA